MSAKEPLSTTEYRETQRFQNYSEDEISLVDLLEVLIREKVLILAITTICTLLAITYTKTVTPTYKATISFLEPQEKYLAQLPVSISKHMPGFIPTNDRDEKKDRAISSPFSMFLSKVSSYAFIKSVLENGDFLKELYPDNAKTLENAALETYESISLFKEEINKELPDFERPLSLVMEGNKPEAMSKTLNALANSAKQDIIDEIRALATLRINNEIKKVTQEIKILRSVSEENTTVKSNSFIEALNIARKMGIKNNNFDKIKSSNIDVGISSQGGTSLDLSSDEFALTRFMRSQEKANIKIRDTTLPTWFLYGEKALEEELNRVKLRSSKEIIPGLGLKQILLSEYTSIDPNSLEIEVITINQPSIAPTKPIKPKSLKIISMAMSAGLVIGVAIAFIHNGMIQLRKRQQPTSQTAD